MKLTLFLIIAMILVSFQVNTMNAQSVSGYDYLAGTEFKFNVSNIYDNSTSYIKHDTNSIPLKNASNTVFENVTVANQLFVNNDTITAYLKNDVNNSINRDEILICLTNFTSFLTIPSFKNVYTINSQAITYDFNTSDLVGPLMNHFSVLIRSFNSLSDLEYFIQAYPQVQTHSGFYNFSIESNYVTWSHISVSNSSNYAKIVTNYNFTYNWRTGIFKSYQGYFYTKDKVNIVRIKQFDLNYIGLKRPSTTTSPSTATSPFYSFSLFLALPVMLLAKKKRSRNL